MKNAMLLLTMLCAAIATGCCGGSMAQPVPSTQQTATVWQFQDGFNHHMSIAVSSLPCAYGICADNIRLWHYTKDNCQAYWNIRTATQCSNAVRFDELWFVIHKDSDGAWRCIGFNYVDYLGIKWKVQIFPVTGQAPAYTIIPASATASDPLTSYNAIVQESPDGDIATDFTPPSGVPNVNSTWQTFASTEPFTSQLSGPVTALVSHQHENCIEEKWDFLNGELMRVLPIVGIGDTLTCAPIDPLSTMIRIR